MSTFSGVFVHKNGKIYFNRHIRILTTTISIFQSNAYLSLAFVRYALKDTTNGKFGYGKKNSI
jgi:hypothetical protein